MRRRNFTGVLLAGTACPFAALAASEGEAALGVRTALERAAVAAVGLLGRNGGFLDDPRVRIPLPGFLDDLARFAAMAGQQARIDELVTAMNRAAEAAVPAAKSLLVGAVKSMGFDDARRIVTGGEQAATDFFAARTREPIGRQFLPIVTRETKKVALAEKFDAVAGRVAAFGLLRPDQASLPQYVTGKALDGLFSVIGEQERKIRSDPIGTGSAILAKVFGRG